MHFYTNHSILSIFKLLQTEFCTNKWLGFYESTQEIPATSVNFLISHSETISHPQAIKTSTEISPSNLNDHSSSNQNNKTAAIILNSESSTRVIIGSIPRRTLCGVLRTEERSKREYLSRTNELTLHLEYDTDAEEDSVTDVWQVRFSNRLAFLFQSFVTFLHVQIYFFNSAGFFACVDCGWASTIKKRFNRWRSKGLEFMRWRLWMRWRPMVSRFTFHALRPAAPLLHPPDNALQWTAKLRRIWH